ncbi:uncharacterized protein MELLADRAFT_108025 [Melampsora larici-populina 98AG31]|uniref:Uncharacterized protein n=1 Tax=Melampsora larici-populina (strain 98AG31 / pathotype 3-4-7) TaxID=747676 RepID=F4RRQ4_MELLP|nr:uncharacterized protein MELLADRAFT_108025 [Melampsora larici-populina 98AG31]EGG04982.1 hypothetical protein MELLADRAFT_108025 [Melampsora larici-populina 98AG31]
MTYVIDPRYRPMQTVVHNAPTAYQVAAAYHAGVQVNPQRVSHWSMFQVEQVFKAQFHCLSKIYYIQNSPNPHPLQQTQNYINYAQSQNHAQIGTHAHNHAQNPIQKRVKISHPQETPAKVYKRSSPQMVLQKRAHKQSHQQAQRSQIRAKGTPQTQTQPLAQINAQPLAQIHAPTPVKIHAQGHAQIHTQSPAQVNAQINAQPLAQLHAPTPKIHAPTPVRIHAQGPAQIHTKSPAQINAQPLAQLHAQTTTHTQTPKTPAQTTVKIPAQGPAQIPAQAPKIPAQTTVNIPTQSSAQIPAQTPVKIPAQGPAQILTQSSAQKPKQNLAQKPVKHDAQNSTRRPQAVRVDRLQAPAPWKTNLERLMDDIESDQEFGYSPEFHMKVMAASKFCVALYASYASSTSTNFLYFSLLL